MGCGYTAGVPPYWSLVTDALALRDALVRVVWRTDPADEGEIQAMRHRELPIWGVQFHPESWFGEWGREVLGGVIST